MRNINKYGIGEDGDKDAPLLLTHDPSGSGTFYYVAATINVNGRYQATNTVLLDDLIPKGHRTHLAYEFCIPDTVQNRTDKIKRPKTQAYQKWLQKHLLIHQTYLAK